MHGPTLGVDSLLFQPPGTYGTSIDHYLLSSWLTHVAGGSGLQWSIPNGLGVPYLIWLVWSQGGVWGPSLVWLHPSGGSCHSLEAPPSRGGSLSPRAPSQGSVRVWGQRMRDRRVPPWDGVLGSSEDDGVGRGSQGQCWRTRRFFRVRLMMLIRG